VIAERAKPRSDWYSRASPGLSGIAGRVTSEASASSCLTRRAGRCALHCRAVQLAELEVHSSAVAVLRVLNEEHYEEGGDRCVGVVHELTGAAAARSGRMISQMPSLPWRTPTLVDGRLCALSIWRSGTTASAEMDA
jgi:hypothetical protein